MTINIYVINQELRLATPFRSLVDGTQEFIKFKFILDNAWSKITTFAQFTQNGTAYNVYLDENNCVYLPPEINAGTFTLMLYGTGNNTIGTSNYLTLKVSDNILIEDAQSTEVTQSLYSQLVNIVDGVNDNINTITTARTSDIGKYLKVKSVNNGKVSAWEFDEGGSSGGGGGSGQDGQDGYSPTITVTNITGGHRVSITDVNGTKRFDVMNGTNGTNGFSPTVTVANITGGHRVSITDASGTKTFDVMDGTSSSGSGEYSLWSSKKVCVFGDSIGYGYNNNAHSFVDVLRERGFFASVHKNCVSGSTTATWTARLQESSTEIADADIIYAEYEANDIVGLKAGTLTTDALVSTVRNCTSAIRNVNPTCIIIWMPLTIQHLSKIAGTDLSYYQSWVNAMYPVFAELGINMLPIFDTLNTNHASSDGRHPNDAGHEAIAELIIQNPLGYSLYSTENITIDNTLTVSGAAADSKTVGDTFSLLTQDFNQKLQVFNSSRDGLVPKSGGDDLNYTYYGCTANSVTITKVGSNVLISNIQTSTNYIWCGVGLGITRAIVTAGQTELILLAVDLTNNRMLLLRPSASAIIIANIGGGTTEIATVVENVAVPSTNYVIEVTETGIRISVNGNGTDYAVPNMGNYTGDLGFCWLLGRETGSASLRYTLLTDESASNRFLRSDGLWISPDTSGEQWNGKTWYAYGTSITNITSEGKYPTYLAQMSGMILVNKGISGGGIGNLGGYSQGQVYDAICNITDGKLDADLITLETGANDIAADVPLGAVYDTGQSTLAGCLNDCLQYLQANTDAQIVVLPSPVTTTQNPNSATKAYEWFKMIREICDINRVHFINSNNNMGWGKLSSNKGSAYIVDHGHHTDLGGYIFAQNIWYQLRNIPTFNIEGTLTDTWTELFDGNLTVEAYQDSYRLSVIDNYTDTMSVGDTYRVTFKGTQYVCEATADENTGLIYIGNRRWSGGDTSSANEPFIAYVNNGKLRILSGETAGSTISFKIEKYTL